MKTPEAISPGIVEVAADVPVELRLPLLCRAAALSFTAIEREHGLARGAISEYVGGRQYAYPKLREAVCSSLAVALGEKPDTVRACLFPE